MYQCRLRHNCKDFEEFQNCSDIYGLAERLGFDSAREAWDANPVVQGSTIPSDYKIVPWWKRLIRFFKYKHIGKDGCKYV